MLMPAYDFTNHQNGMIAIARATGYENGKIVSSRRLAEFAKTKAPINNANPRKDLQKYANVWRGTDLITANSADISG